MRMLMLFLLASSIGRSGLSQQSSPAPDEQPAALSEIEKRTVLGQLLELEQCRRAMAAYEAAQKQRDAADAREREYWARALELEKQAVALAQREKIIVEKERDNALDRAQFYEQAYKLATKKRGFGCTLLKIFTLGISGCH